MENMNLNIVPDVDLMAKAQIMLHEKGLDLKTTFSSFLRDLSKIKETNIYESH